MAEIENKPRAENTTNLVEELYFGTAEKTQAESAYHGDSYLKPYPPDDIWQKSGDFSIYEDMKNDDQVNIALQLKKDLVVGSGWSIVTEESGDNELADDIYQRLSEDPEIALDEHLEELIDCAYSYGFACSEKIFKLRDDQSLTLKELKTRHPDTWLIHTDKYGNIEKYEQRAADENLDINPKSLIHYINQRRYQNPYGTSDLRACYSAYFVKRHIIRYYSIFLEKYSSPTPVARYDANIPQSKADEIFDIIKKFQTKTALAIPKNFEIEFLEASKNGEAYTRGIDLFNMFIGRSLLVPDLMGFSGSETSGGSFSLGKEQMEIFFKHIARRRKQLERIVNRHIVQPLVVYNYGNVENFPKFIFNPISEDNALDFARTFLEAVKGRVYKPSEEEVNHFRSLIKFPEGDVEFKDEPAGPFGGFSGQPNKEEQNIEKGEGLDAKEEELKKEDVKEYKSVYDSPAGNYSDKVDFKAIEAQLNNAKENIMSEVLPLIKEQIFDIEEQIQKKKILLGNGKPERIDTIKLKKLSTLKQLLKKHFKDHFVKNKLIARNELFKRDFSEPLPSEMFLEVLEQENFRYVGDYEYQVTKAVKNRLVKALKDGENISAVLADIDSEIVKLGQVSVERYARTKLTEVMNRARVEEFDSSGAVQGYQFSAIMDDRTTPICRGLHGKKFKKGTEPIPPLHFNCRSVLIPITIFEKYKPDEKVGKTDIGTFLKDNVGKGFPVK